MAEPSKSDRTLPAPDMIRDVPSERFERFVESGPPSLLRRFLSTWRHSIGLGIGGLHAWVRSRPPDERLGINYRFAQLASLSTRWLIRGEIRRQPFPIQLRRRFEMLGPTYIKLGQILSLRQDLLPSEVTSELQNLLDSLPAIGFERFFEIVSHELGRPATEVFAYIEPEPHGSASIGQTHRATTLSGEAVILKIVKPGIRETLRRDMVLLRMLGFFLELILPRLRPRQVIEEFCTYTLREVDLAREADNAEIFAANFDDLSDVRFPDIYRGLSTPRLLTMEFLDGAKPSSERAKSLSLADRNRLVDLGAESIIRMLYKDGFFHADLHPGNLLVLPGAKVGFIDLGMVGRFSDETRRTLLYYFYCLVSDDPSGAARYLSMLAQPSSSGDPDGFRREVEEICRRWQRTPSFADFSLGQLILKSVAQGAQYRMYFPVETVLMVKAIVTFEAVGNILVPGFDIAEVSKNHINQIFMNQFSPLRLGREGIRSAPDLVDALVKAPMLVTEGLRVLEQATKRPSKNPLAGLRGSLFAGFCVLGGTVLLANGQPWYLGVAFMTLGFMIALKGD